MKISVNFIFCIRLSTFSTHMALQLFIIKIYFTNKVSATCVGGQLLVSVSQGLSSRVPGVSVPCPRVASSKSRVTVLGSQIPVPGPDFRLCQFLFLSDQEHYQSSVLLDVVYQRSVYDYPIMPLFSVLRKRPDFRIFLLAGNVLLSYSKSIQFTSVQS